MSYENPQVPHEVNVSRVSVAREFLQLLAGLGLVVLVVAAVLYFAGGALARHVPFAVEQKWAGDTVLGPLVDASARDGAPAADVAAMSAYLQRVADALAAHMDLPAGMTVRVHWSESEVPNAFATLGGHVVVNRGLYELMPSENALAMVLAHEIGHVRARDPIAALGGSASLAVVFVLLGASSEQLTPHVAQAVELGYSRQAEARADAAGLAAVVATYGHAGGTADAFEALAKQAGSWNRVRVSLFESHPADSERIAPLRRAAEGWDPKRAPLRPLAVALPARAQ